MSSRPYSIQIVSNAKIKKRMDKIYKYRRKKGFCDCVRILVFLSYFFNFRQVQAGVHSWSYADTDYWSRKYQQCGGKSQSPINIDTSSLRTLYRVFCIFLKLAWFVRFCSISIYFHHYSYITSIQFANDFINFH